MSRTPDPEREPELNPPAGDLTDRPFSAFEIRELIRDAELLRYSPGTEEHEGNVMAVFRRPDGTGIGLTMSEESDTPDSLIGRTVRKAFPYLDIDDRDDLALIFFRGVDGPENRIRIRDSVALGVYEVELDATSEPEPENAEGSR